MGCPRHLLALLALALWTAPGAYAQSHLSVSIIDDRVSLFAQNVPLRRIIEEWRRASGVTIVNGERLNNDTPLSLQLTDVPQRAALETLLRGAGGYVIALRTDATTIDRIVILPNRTAPSDLARAADQVLHTPEQPALSTTDDVSAAVGPETVPVGDVTTPAGPESGVLSADMREPAVARQGSPARARINSSDSIVDLVGGANRATLVPPELRPPTPLLMQIPTATGTATPGVVTPSLLPPGVYIPVPTTVVPDNPSGAAPRPR